MPRLAGKAEAERLKSPCEQALSGASASLTLSTSLPMLSSSSDVQHRTSVAAAEPLMIRYLAAKTTPLLWIDAAAECSARFGEGVLRNAQSKIRVAAMASRFHQSAPVVDPARLDGVTDLQIDLDVLDTFALAEDRAGFAIGILAARSESSGATLALSDMHKTAAQQLVSIADNAAASQKNGSVNHDDPRHKAYAIDTLLAHPSTIEDTPSGRAVPTTSAIEMDCARTEITAVATAIEHGTHTDAATLRILAALAAKHAYTAMQLGYPSDDAALFV